MRKLRFHGGQHQSCCVCQVKFSTWYPISHPKLSRRSRDLSWAVKIMTFPSDGNERKSANDWLWNKTWCKTGINKSVASPKACITINERHRRGFVFLKVSLFQQFFLVKENRAPIKNCSRAPMGLQISISQFIVLTYMKRLINFNCCKS